MENNFEKQRQFDIRREQESQFTKENWMIRVNNELHSKFLPIDIEKERERPENHLHLLNNAKKYYQEIGDDFNLFRIQLKKGNVKNAEEMAQDFLTKSKEINLLSHYFTKPEDMEGANILELKKAYIVSDLANCKKDNDLKNQAAERFLIYAKNQSERKELSGYEASALSYWQARILTPKYKRDKITEKCITQFRKVADNRAGTNDRWWESIALRQIGKISYNPEDKNIALQRSEELIHEYTEMGDFKKAALWARDVNDLNPTEENAKRMEELWNKNIEISKKNGDTRTIGKSFWSLYKRVKKYDAIIADEYRIEAINCYEKLLNEEKDKENPNEERIRECYWVFSELIQ